jgi:hypothetical protein
MAGDNMLIEDDEDQKGGKPQEVEFVPVEDKEPKGSDRDDDSEDDDHEDSRLSEDNEDREELRRKRREEKADRAARRKQAIERDKTELNFLRQRNEALEKRMFNVEKTTVANTISSIDARLADTVAEVKAAERIMAKAIEAGNGDDAAKALRIRDEAMKKVQQLQIHKHQHSEAAQNLHRESQAAPAPAGPDPDVASHAQNWVSKNSWYNPNGNDEASKIVLAIDQSLVESGYNPKTQEYWNELDKRVARRLPELKGGGNNDDSHDDDRRGQRRGPPVGSSRDNAPSSTRREVYISPERKQAMTDAGVWDDPVLRQRYLKQYAKWDRDNNSSR